MNKIILLFVFLFSFLVSSFAQNMLRCEDISNPLSKYRNDGKNEAKVIVHCFEPFELTFDSNLDSLEYIEKTVEKLEGVTKYNFIFPTERPGQRLNNRTLTVYAANFAPIRIRIGQLMPADVKEYKITDPSNLSLYQTYIKTGDEHFTNMQYDEAKTQYQLAIQSPEYAQETILDLERKIADIDSVQVLKTKADDYFMKGEYRNAYTTYIRMLAFNAADDYAKRRASESQTSLDNFCISYFRQAEALFNEGKYKEARPLYQRVVEQSCSQYIEASDRIRMIDTHGELRAQNSTVITYEYGKNVPIGFSSGSYKDRKWGGYFSLHFNTDIIGTFRSEYDKVDKAEVDLSFGWTKKVVWPVWIFFGPGYSGVGEYVYEEDDDDPSLKFYHAVSPEIGILAKYKFVAIRYTFQYRFAINKDHEDIIGKTKHFIGIGVAF